MPSKNSAAILSFNDRNPNWSPQTEYNKLYIRAASNYLTDLLLSRGHVFLNEAYDELGFPRTQQGALDGWILDDGSQGKVNIEVHENNGEFRLEFITDGVIYNRI